MTRAIMRQTGFDVRESMFVCILAESSLQIASMQLKSVPSRAKCENGASSKIILFVTGRKVIDGKRQNLNTNLWMREQSEDSSIQSSGTDKLRNAPK